MIKTKIRKKKKKTATKSKTQNRACSLVDFTIPTNHTA